MALMAGLGGAFRHGCVALVDHQRVLGACEQERVTRVKGAGFNPTGLPDEALDMLLERLGQSRDEVTRYAIAETGRPVRDDRFAPLDHHLAHACASYLSSPFSSAAIVVCDHEPPRVSVWHGCEGDVTRVEWPWRGPGFADLYSDFTGIFGLRSGAGGRNVEGLARLDPNRRDDRLRVLLGGDGECLHAQEGWQATARGWLPGGPEGQPGSRATAALASALQTRAGELLIGFLERVREHVGDLPLCLGGDFFCHSAMNTLAKRAGPFSRVFVPINPGNAGLAFGAALHVSGAVPRRISPFLGADYQPHEIKETLDNCKLRYDWVCDADAISMTVDAIRRGLLVGWFDGPMEWGPRALGARCILANPFAPYVLENLNRFLKRREPWHGYALSGLEEAVGEHFVGPKEAPYMECDYRPLDVGRFRHILPTPQAALRIQTVGRDGLPRFRALLEAFGQATGMPFLVNTSFNGFHEPIVCTPRDAVRVFYGSGLDMLVLDRFIVAK
jgi:carbamoyltransferase